MTRVPGRSKEITSLKLGREHNSWLPFPHAERCGQPFRAQQSRNRLGASILKCKPDNTPKSSGREWFEKVKQSRPCDAKTTEEKARHEEEHEIKYKSKLNYARAAHTKEARFASHDACLHSLLTAEHLCQSIPTLGAPCNI